MSLITSLSAERPIRARRPAAVRGWPARTLAAATLRCRADFFTARLRAKGRVRRALARLDGALPATVVAELSGPSGRVRDRSPITLRGR